MTILILSSLAQVYFFSALYAPKLLIPLFLYFSFLSFLPQVLAACFVGSLEFLLLYINNKKTVLTDTQLAAIDIIELKQAAAISSYSDPIITIIIVISSILLLAGIWRKRRVSWRWSVLPCILLLTIFFDYNQSSLKKHSLTNTFLETFKLSYDGWNWKKNIRRNGIFAHLIQTLDTLRIPKKEEHNFYKKFLSEDLKRETIKPDIYVIMCESCFTTFDSAFQTDLHRLTGIGFKEALIYSPQYGGGTADVEFEFLTGLPASNLRGIKYQLYGSKFNESSLSLPSFLKPENYQTVGMHNYFSFFWKRNSVYPLIGFNESFFIEDMNWTETDNWKPEDNYLFDKALTHIESQKDLSQNLFYFMVTMYSHGPYPEYEGDLGEKSYREVMKHTTNQIIEFHNKLQNKINIRKKDALIVVFGDHKPSLTELFIKKGIFNENDSETERKNKSSQVPIYFKYLSVNGRNQIQNDLAQEANMKPVYCMPGVILDNLNLNNLFFDALMNACEQETAQLTNIEWLNDNFPLGLYGENLFSDTRDNQER